MVFDELRELKKKIEGYKEVVIFGAGMNGILAYEYI